MTAAADRTYDLLVKNYDELLELRSEQGKLTEHVGQLDGHVGGLMSSVADMRRVLFQGNGRPSFDRRVTTLEQLVQGLVPPERIEHLVGMLEEHCRDHARSVARAGHRTAFWAAVVAAGIAGGTTISLGLGPLIARVLGL